MSVYSPELLAGEFDEAIIKKHLPGSLSLEHGVAPTKEKLNPNRFDSSGFIRAVKTRLMALGYLGKKNKIDDRVDNAYERAVKRFQRDVGLQVIDAWVGRKTWDVLEFLCSFENKQDPAEWLDSWCDYCSVQRECIDFSKNEAVRRALYLRLYALGFIGPSCELNSKTDVNLDTNLMFRDSIRAFCEFSRILSIRSDSSEDGNVDLALLRRVFNYDGLINHIAGYEDFIALQGKYKTQLEAICRIELWLSGYDTHPGPDSEKSVSIRRGAPGKRKRIRAKKSSKMALAIEEFWEDNPGLLKERESQNKVSKSLFFVFRENSEEGGDLEDDTFESEVHEILKNKKSKTELTRQFSSIANSIWDGAKRLVKNLFKWLKRNLKQSIRLIANIARYLSKQARSVYGYVRTSVEIVTNGFQFYGSGLSKESVDGVVVFSQDKDFDQKVLVDYRASKIELGEAYKARLIQSELYGAATRIFRHLFNIFRGVLSMFVSAIGWLRALLTLRRLARSVLAIKDEIDLVKAHVNTF